MIFKFRELLDDGGYRGIIIDDDKLLIKESNEEEEVILSKEDSFTTLINLFSLKNEWGKTGTKSNKYTVYFNNNGEEEIFNFGDDVPSNWLVFRALLSNLVGKYYG